MVRRQACPPFLIGSFLLVLVLQTVTAQSRGVQPNQAADVEDYPFSNDVGGGGRGGDEWWRNYEVVEDHANNEFDDQLEMLYMYSVKPSDVVTTLRPTNANPVVVNRGSNQSPREQPTEATTRRQQQQTPPQPPPSSTAFQTSRFPSTTRSTEAGPSEFDKTDAPVQRRRRPSSSTTTPFVLTTTNAPFRDDDTTEPFVLEGSTGGFSPLRSRNPQPQDARPATQAQPFHPPPQRFSPPQQFPSARQPQQFPPQPSPLGQQPQQRPSHSLPLAPPQQRFAPQPIPLGPPQQIFPPQPLPVGSPQQRFPPQPTGFAPQPPRFLPPLAQANSQSLPPQQLPFENQNQEQVPPKKMRVRVRKPAVQNPEFPVNNEPLIPRGGFNNPTDEDFPPKKVQPNREPQLRSPLGAHSTSFEGIQIAQESGLKHSAVHSNFPSFPFNIPGALFLGSSIKVFKPKPLPSRGPTSPTSNPFLVQATTVPSNAENLPRYARLLNRYSLLESPTGESNLTISAGKKEGVIGEQRNQPNLSRLPAPITPQAPSSRNFPNHSLGGSVSPKSTEAQQQTTLKVENTSRPHHRRQPQPVREEFPVQDSQLSNSDEVTAINEVFVRQTNLRRTQPTSGIPQTTFTTPIYSEEQDSKRIVHDERSNLELPKFNPVPLSRQQPAPRANFSPSTTETPNLITRNIRVGSTLAPPAENQDEPSSLNTENIQTQTRSSGQRHGRFQTLGNTRTTAILSAPSTETPDFTARNIRTGSSLVPAVDNQNRPSSLNTAASNQPRPLNSGQRQARFETGENTQTTASIPSSSEESFTNNLSSQNSGFQARKLSLNANPQPTSFLNITEPINQRGQRRYQTDSENTNRDKHRTSQNLHRRISTSTPHIEQQNSDSFLTSGVTQTTAGVPQGGRLSATGSTNQQSQTRQQQTAQTTPSTTTFQAPLRPTGPFRGRHHVTTTTSTLPATLIVDNSDSGVAAQLSGAPSRTRFQPSTLATILTSESTTTSATSKFLTKKRGRFSTLQLSNTTPETIVATQTENSLDGSLKFQVPSNSDPNEINSRNSPPTDRLTQSPILNHRRRFATTAAAPTTTTIIQSDLTTTIAAPTLTTASSSNKRDVFFRPRGQFAKNTTPKPLGNDNVGDVQNTQTGPVLNNESLRVLEPETTSALINNDDTGSTQNDTTDLLPETTTEQITGRRKFKPRKTNSFNSQPLTGRNVPATPRISSENDQKRNKISNSSSQIGQQQNPKNKPRGSSFRRTTSKPFGPKSATGQSEITQATTTNPPRFKPKPLAKSRLFAQTAAAQLTSTTPGPEETTTILESEISNYTDSLSITTTTPSSPVTEFRKFKPRGGFPRFQDSASKRIPTDIPSATIATASTGSISTTFPDVTEATATNSSTNSNQKSTKRFKPRPITQRFSTTDKTIQSSTPIIPASPQLPIGQIPPEPLLQAAQHQPVKTRTSPFPRGTPIHHSEVSSATPVPIPIPVTQDQATEVFSLSTASQEANSQLPTDVGFGGKRRRRPFAAGNKKSVPTLKHNESTPPTYNSPILSSITETPYFSSSPVHESFLGASNQGDDYLRTSQEPAPPGGIRKRRKLKRRKVSHPLTSAQGDQRGANSNIHAVRTNYTTSEKTMTDTTIDSFPSSVFTTHVAKRTTPSITTFSRIHETTLPSTVGTTAFHTSPAITTFHKTLATTTPAITTFHKAPVPVTTFRTTGTDTITSPTTPVTMSDKTTFKLQTATTVRSPSPGTTPASTLASDSKQKDAQIADKNIKTVTLSTNKIKEISKSKLLAAISAQQRLALEEVTNSDHDILAMEADESGDASGIWFTEPDGSMEAISGSGIQRRASGGGGGPSEKIKRRVEMNLENSSPLKINGDSSAASDSLMADGKTWFGLDGSSDSSHSAAESSPKKIMLNPVDPEIHSTSFESHTSVSMLQNSDEPSMSPSSMSTTTVDSTTSASESNPSGQSKDDATSKNVLKSRSASFSVSSSTSVQKEVSKTSSSSSTTNDNKEEKNKEKGPPTLIIIDKVTLDDDPSSLNERDGHAGSSSSRDRQSSHEIEIEVTTVPTEEPSSTKGESDADSTTTSKPSTHRPLRNRTPSGGKSDKPSEEKEEESSPRSTGIARSSNRDRLPKSNARRNQARSDATSTTNKPEQTTEANVIENTTPAEAFSDKPTEATEEVKVKSPFDEVGYFGEEEVAPSSHGALDGPLDGELESGALDGIDSELSPAEAGAAEEVTNAGVSEHTDPTDSGHKSEPAAGGDDSLKWEFSPLSDFNGPIRESPSFNIEVRSRAPKSVQLAARREAKSSRSDLDDEDEVRFLDDRVEPQKKMRTILKLIELKSRFTAERNGPRQVKNTSSSSEVEAFLETLDRDMGVEDESPKRLVGLGKYAYNPMGAPPVATSSEGASEFFKLLTTASPLLAENSPKLKPKANISATDILSGGPVNCSRSERNICPTDEGYPSELVESIVSKHNEEVQRLWRELQVGRTPEQLYPEDAKRQKADLSVCDSVVEALKPGWAMDAVSGKWMLIVNTEQYPQVVRVESCLRPKKECLFISPYYKSLCVEHRSTQRMVAIRPDQPERGPVIGIFKLPCGCSCQIEMLHGAASNSN